MFSVSIAFMLRHFLLWGEGKVGGGGYTNSCEEFVEQHRAKTETSLGLVCFVEKMAIVQQWVQSGKWCVCVCVCV